MARQTTECPHCGEIISIRALACPECGSDASTGWASEEEIGYQAVEIPEEWPEGGYEPDGRSITPRWIRMTALAVVASMLLFLAYRLLA